MTKAVILKCPKYGRFHFGLTGLDENASLYQSSEFPHSDTLFSAIIVQCAKTFPTEVENLITAFQENDILISSACYCLEIDEGEASPNRKDDYIFFLPKPVYFEVLNEESDERKRVQDVAYISKQVWEKGITPLDEEEYGFDWNGECQFIDGGRFLLHKSDIFLDSIRDMELISTTTTAPKIADHARRKLNNIYFQTDLFLGYYEKENIRIQPHFYFLLDFSNEVNSSLKNLLFTLLELLGDEGIGGGVSTGCGQLKGLEILDFSWDFLDQEGNEISAHPKYAASMSLTIPTANDIIMNGKLMLRGGRTIAQKYNESYNNRLDRLRMVRRVQL